MLLIIHFGGILNQQDPGHLSTLFAGGLQVRLHQGLIAHMRILAEAIDGLGPGKTTLLGGDGSRWFPSHRGRDGHRSARPSHVAQVSASKGLLSPLLGRYQLLHFHHLFLLFFFSFGFLLYYSITFSRLKLWVEVRARTSHRPYSGRASPAASSA